MTKTNNVQTKRDTILWHVENRNVLEAIGDAIRYISNDLKNCPETEIERLEFLQERLEDHQLLNHQFEQYFARSLETLRSESAI